MKHQPNSTTENLDKQTKLYTFLAVLTLGITAVLLGLIIMLTNQEVKKVSLAKQELANLQGSVQNMASLQTFAQSKAADIKQINSLFPGEDDFVYVLQDIEAIVKATDPNGSVKVGASSPVRTQNQNTLPLIITLSADATNTISFLRQFERLPYIIQITNLDLKSPQGTQDLIQTLMTVRLYVADPFNT